ncbi:MAG: FAD-dependent thymidylate synthase, partial [Proteobacteria bacterium]|nr:FAD-dependent thymidylate synthase [Pseudomonadota bacterium]
MEIIEQTHELLGLPENGLQLMEKAGRTCYKSEDKITGDSAERFVAMLVKSGHHAMIEFGDMVVKLVTNRGVTHELVRHRHCSFAQESTRYVKYDGQMEFIRPVWCSDRLVGSWPEHASVPPGFTPAEQVWMQAMARAESDYKTLLQNGWKAQHAREILPNSLKTEIVVKANIREWRHVFALRCAKASHPQMVALMLPLLKEVQTKIPVVFD